MAGPASCATRCGTFQLSVENEDLFYGEMVSSSLRLFRFFIAIALPAIITFSILRADTENGFFLKNGDRVVFYGDSITDQRLYTSFVETYVLTRFPTMDITFVHSGWGGDTVAGGKSSGNIDTRLERDVFVYKPTVMTVMLGMNDGRYRPFDQQLFDTYRTGMAAIVEKVRKRFPDIRMTLLRPTPYDEITRGFDGKVPGGYNPVLIRFGEAVQKIAEDNNLSVIDLNTPMVALLEKAKSLDSAVSEKIIPDHIHPLKAGQLAMAFELLRAWNAPALVTDVGIDAVNRKLTVTTNTKVTDFTVADGKISWTQLDGALPMPVDRQNPETALVLRCIDFDSLLDQQTLRITGLDAPTYRLLIDGQAMGEFTNAQLAEGINLAKLSTPMISQAEKVNDLTLKRTALVQTRRNTFQVPYADSEESIRDNLDRLMSSLADAAESARAIQRQMAIPVPHRYEVVPVGGSAPERTTAP